MVCLKIMISNDDMSSGRRSRRNFCYNIIDLINNKMIIRRNIPTSKINSHPNNNEYVFPLCQKEPFFDQQTPQVNLPSYTLNPEHPITSVLVEKSEKDAQMAGVRQYSEFSFKDRGFLSQEDPQHLDLPADIHQQNAKISTKKVQQASKSQEKTVSDDRKPFRGKKCIGMITNHAQHSSHSRPNPSQSSQKAVKKPLSNSLGSSRLQSVLNKIKSLRIDATSPLSSQQSQRYSTVRQWDQKVSSTDTSGEETSPIRKQVISSIRKQVERMNLSLVRDHRIKQQDSETEQNSLLLFKIQEKSLKSVPEDMLQGKNKSFLVRSTNKKMKKYAEIVQISYKTTLLQLKQLCGRFDQTIKVKMIVPSILALPIFDPTDREQSLFEKAAQALQQLSVASLQSMAIRKYSNCVIILKQDLALISYFSGQAYFGGWKKGSKQGLGLEILPQRWAYYGQYKNNKREGWGVMKQWRGGAVAGEWKAGRDLGCKIF